LRSTALVKTYSTFGKPIKISSMPAHKLWSCLLNKRIENLMKVLIYKNPSSIIT
jgi:hypothetical protein